MNRRTILCMLMAGLVMTAWSGAAMAAEGKLTVAVGAWLQELDGLVQVTEAGVPGTSVDLESTLGIDNDTSPSLTFCYRPGGRYKLTGGFTSMENSGRKTVTTAVSFKGVQYNVNAVLTSLVETTLFDLNYHRLLSETEKGDLSFMLGLRYLDVETSITGEVGVTTVARTESFEVPVPVIGLSGQTRMSDKVTLAGSFGYLELDSGDDKGKVTDLDLQMIYHLQDDLNITVGYRSLDLEAESGDDRAEIKYSGIKLFVSKKF